MHSIWETDSFYHPTDILIVGSGLTGLFTAIEFKTQNPGLSVRIIERGHFPEGASLKNAGFACFGSLSEVLDDISRTDKASALKRIEKRYLGIQKLLSVTSPAAIDYQQHHGFEIFTEKEATLFSSCKDNLENINSEIEATLGFRPYSFVDNTFGFSTEYPILKIRNEGALHSGKLVSKLVQIAKSLGVIFTFGFNLQSINVEGSQWKASDGEISFKATKLVLATNGFSGKIVPGLNIEPARGQLLLTEPIPDLKLDGTFHAHEGYFYFRAIHNQILLGGGRNFDRINENTDSQKVSEIIQHALEELLHDIILPGKKVKIVRRWAGTMAFGSENEKDPIVKELEKNLYIGARLGGMGVAMAPILAEELSELVLK